MTNINLFSIPKEEFLAKQNQEFLSYHHQLMAQGFIFEDASEMQHGDIHSQFTLYFDPINKLWAMVATLKAQRHNFNAEQTYMELIQYYTDHTILSVINKINPSVYPKMAYKTTIKYDNIDNLHELMTLHKKAQHLFTPTKQPARSFNNALSPLELVKETIRIESDNLQKIGFVKAPIDENGERQLTFIGAFRSLLRLIPPFKYYFIRQNKNLAEKVRNHSFTASVMV